METHHQPSRKTVKLTAAQIEQLRKIVAAPDYSLPAWAPQYIRLRRGDLLQGEAVSKSGQYYIGY